MTWTAAKNIHTESASLSVIAVTATVELKLIFHSASNNRHQAEFGNENKYAKQGLERIILFTEDYWLTFSGNLP